MRNAHEKTPSTHTPPREANGSVPGERRAKTNGARGKAHEGRRREPSIHQVFELAGRLPRRLQHALKTEPVVVVVVVGIASFLGGVLSGSRLARALLAAAVPFGLEHLVHSEFGTKLWRSFDDLAEG